MELDTIICGDCLDVMAEMPDGCVDLVVTSLPFGVGKEYERDQNMGTPDHLIAESLLLNRRDHEREITFDELLRLIRCTFAELERVVVSGGYVVIEFGTLVKGWKLFGLVEPCEMPMGWIYWAFGLSAGFLLQSQRIWKKKFERIVSSRHAINAPRNVLEFENIYTFRRMGKPGKQAIRDRSISQKGIWDSSDETETVLTNHPAAFPELIPTNAILIYTDAGDLVFDPFMGSGTTAVAALKLGRHFYGCDISPEYVKLANERVERTQLEMAQMNFLSEVERR